MQNSQEINWFMILAPSLIVGLSAIIVQILLAYWLSKVSENYKKDLSKEIESYKTELNKELENHKIQLQSDFQTRFFEFQTRYSLFYQKRANAIEKVYSLTTKMNSNIKQFHFDTIYKTGLFDPSDIAKQFEELVDCKDENRILFGDNINENLDSMTKKMGKFLLMISEQNEKPINPSSKETESLFQEIEDQVTQIVKILELEFRKLLSAENSNYQIVRKQ